jgi:hypothetical protein
VAEREREKVLHLVLPGTPGLFYHYVHHKKEKIDEKKTICYLFFVPVFGYFSFRIKPDHGPGTG